MISLIVELPEGLQTRLLEYLDKHPDSNQDAAIAAALSVFLASRS